ncbi:antibiotic biosynthesis monooxygenase [Pseudoalteromonas sp. NZS127_1]|uniref:putative quinol monooxygenase n=1 Tax=Pseudoalteromonas sp. NZS127_1 TaxID=2792074 RepID=UPI0018CF19B9|nr:antibiotic biosynthesis monooxygenase [Pseudoalteromonas sp. NZS127_1]MBG9995800.1 antibiotic biosynthesis monooxygenase [Pseudoalteromonas sp. NZS127_1]
MKNHVTWTVQGQIKEGKYDEFLLVMAQLIASAKSEAGTLIYEWTVSEDKRSVHIYERYQDEDAAKTHLAGWAKSGPLFLSVVDMDKVTVFSQLSEEFAQAFAGPSTVFMKPVGGFVKF